MEVVVDCRRWKVFFFLIFFGSLVERGANINAFNGNLYTPLHLAVTYKQGECVRILVSSGADLETTNKKHKTPLEVQR
jgi:ankyrin repeat protein